jgi:hypothetical protein
MRATCENIMLSLVLLREEQWEQQWYFIDIQRRRVLGEPLEI